MHFIRAGSIDPRMNRGNPYGFSRAYPPQRIALSAIVFFTYPQPQVQTSTQPVRSKRNKNTRTQLRVSNEFCRQSKSQWKSCFAPSYAPSYVRKQMYEKTRYYENIRCTEKIINLSSTFRIFISICCVFWLVYFFTEN